MAGTRRGIRYGRTKQGAPTGVDPDSPDRSIGDHLRELRVEADMRLRDLAEAMRGQGFPRWSEDVASLIQTGRRSLSAAELRALAWLLDTTADEFLAGALGEPTGQALDVEDMHPAELLKLARALDTTADQLLADSRLVPMNPPEFRARRPNVVRYLASKVTRWTPELPPFHGYEGQAEQLSAIADELRIPRNELCRQAFDLLIKLYREREET